MTARNLPSSLIPAVLPNLRSKTLAVSLATLLGSSLLAISPNLYADTVVTPIQTLQNGSLTNSSLPNASLPNAYELLQRIEAQNREIARLAGEVERLNTELNNQQSPYQSAKQQDALNQSISEQVNRAIATQNADLNNRIDALIDAKVEAKIKARLRGTPSVTASNTQDAIDASRTPRPPYLTRNTQDNYQDNTQNNETQTQGDNDTLLLTNIDLPANEWNRTASTTAFEANLRGSNPLTGQANNRVAQGEQAYANAYLALKEDGVAVAINEMQTFIATYVGHPRLPDAHYWLGEFYLKQKPANTRAAIDNFAMVVNNYGDYPTNDKQSKALYRLATLNKARGQSQVAKDYANVLLSDYPESPEANLARKMSW